MKKTVTLLSIFCLLTLFVSSALALRPHFQDRMADRDYKIARRAYRAFVKDYGMEPEKWPSAEKERACREIGRALHTNRHEVTFADILRQRDLKKQIRDLEGFAKELSCPDKK